MSVGALAGLVAELPDDLRRRALTHSSWTEEPGSYERLAYLGDSVLALAVAAELHERFEDEDAGGLTKIHNHAVSGVACAAVGRELGVPAMLEAAEPRVEEAIPAEILLEGSRPLPEVTEALIGACFLAFGFERVAAAVVAAFAPHIEYATEAPVDAKSTLQELLARRGARVSYAVIAESGPAHRRTFEVEAIVGEERVGTGAGRSKKAAEQMAAEQALKRLGDRPGVASD
ncbi:MAG TPA: putative dsRNA-binding protein [Solirubrobacterales bacterium]|nr:putative dsRNA-binding protein [Solirubrobacterales bacterium]